MQVQKLGNQPAFGSTVTLEKGLVKAINKQKISANRKVLLEIVEGLKADTFENKHYNFGTVLTDTNGNGFFNANLGDFTKRLTMQAIEKCEYLGKNFTAATDKVPTYIPLDHLHIYKNKIVTKIDEINELLGSAKSSKINEIEKLIMEGDALSDAKATRAQIKSLAQK